jgi:hypothetical protein
MKSTSLRQVLLLATFLCVGAKAAVGQFMLSGEIRPRAEFRNGFKTVSPEGAAPAFFVEQRSRLNLNHQAEKLRVRLSLQDIRIWGNTGQIYKTDPSLFNVFEAYGDYRITPRMAVRVGRQELDYDNARFLGGLDWAQQGRSHDAARWMYADTSGFSVHAGAGFNQNVPSEPTQLSGTFYSGLDNYKTMQYLWLHKDWSRGKISLLVFNDGRQRSDTTVAFRQTYGLVGEKKVDRSTLGGELYYQGGKDPAGRTVNAWLAAFSTTFATPLTPLTVGVDYLSGSNAYATQNRSFAPLYGTNHAFYGFMDYFYVGSNHGQNGRTAGLIDLYLKTNFKLSKKASLLANYHHFQSPTTVLAPEGSTGFLSSRLGDEVDLVYNLNLNPEVNLKVGYSHLIATESLEALKNRKDGGLNQWAWGMITFKPVFFTAK